MKSQMLAGCMLSAVMISLAFATAGCGHPRSPAELEAGLDDPDPVVRRKSADGLRHGDEVPAEAIPKLLAAISKEQDPEVYGAELITLGASGVPDAKPLICKSIGGGPSGDVRMSRWASHALTAWMRNNPTAPGCSGTPLTPAGATPASPPPAATTDTRSM
jgi:HEAT repeats